MSFKMFKKSIFGCTHNFVGERHLLGYVERQNKSCEKLFWSTENKKIYTSRKYYFLYKTLCVDIECPDVG
jgi:hypothetical protein